MIVVFGGSGFLGTQVVNSLLGSGLRMPGGPVQHYDVIVADMTAPPPNLLGTGRVVYRQIDATQPDQVDSVIDERTAAVFHLAAVVRGTAEANFDLGMAVNLYGTLNILDACRRQGRFLPFLTTSSIAVFGPDAREVRTPDTPLHPQSSYGTQKAVIELLCGAFRRKGFVDARVLRLPTITVRPGVPNGAASSFVSGIVREPAQGTVSNCPVDADLPIWVASPDVTVRNIVHATSVRADDWPSYGVLDAPGLSTTAGEMVEVLDLLTEGKGKGLVTWEKDERIDRIVSSWPRSFDTSAASGLGFIKDASIGDSVAAFLSTLAISVAT
jgi:nucleoside-diphosphate-sugar epimerase